LTLSTRQALLDLLEFTFLFQRLATTLQRFNSVILQEFCMYSGQVTSQLFLILFFSPWAIK